MSVIGRDLRTAFYACPLCLYRFSYGFSCTEFPVYNVYLGIEFAFQLPAYNIKMHLSQPAIPHLVCFFVFERRILLLAAAGRLLPCLPPASFCIPIS